MGEKTTIMVLKVDLECSSCYKKVKKVLCKFPQIRDQVYDVKSNTITIKVVCCNPEKTRDKLCCKGCGVIKSIEIKEAPKPKAPEKPKEPEKPKLPEKPKEAEKPPIVIIEKPKEPEKPKQPEKPKEPEKPKPPPPQPQPQPPTPEPMPVQEYPHGYCCGQCHAGQTGGPCYNWYGRPVPPPPCYGPYGARPYGYGRGCYVSRCDQYFSDENASGCSIMVSIGSVRAGLFSRATGRTLRVMSRAQNKTSRDHGFNIASPTRHGLYLFYTGRAHRLNIQICYFVKSNPDFHGGVKMSVNGRIL